jgi:hypothetical protein
MIPTEYGIALFCAGYIVGVLTDFIIDFFERRNRHTRR